MRHYTSSDKQDLGNTQNIAAEHADQRPLMDVSSPQAEGIPYAITSNNPATGNSGAAPITMPAPSALINSGKSAYFMYYLQEGRSDLVSAGFVQNLAYYNLGPTYPEPVQITGTLDRFLHWIPMPRDNVTETYTLLYWERIFQYFTTGWLCKVTALDLDQKENLTSLSKHTVHEGAGYKEGGSGAKPRSLILVNHNKPDSVITYLSAKFDERLCMVIEAKPAGEWGTVSCRFIRDAIWGSRD